MPNIFMIRDYIVGRLYHIALRPFFGSIGKGTLLIRPLKLQGLAHIRLGERVVIQHFCWLGAQNPSGGDVLLEIGEGSNIGHFNHIYSTHRVIIGKYVLTADRVYISDNIHNYRNVQQPIMFQGVSQKRDVHVGDGTWIGENAAVIGASIGRNCVIGANSVVLSDIPDYCVAVGAPARVVKRYNQNTQTWEAN